MPAIRLVKRSRRISKQEPLPYDGAFDVQLKNYPPSPKLEPACLPPVDFRSLPLPAVPFEPLLEHPRFIPLPSHARKRKEGHIPRPPNAFILFRSDLWAKQRVNSSVERDHRQISRIAAFRWNQLEEEERRPFRERAKAEKEYHALTWPNYKYSPVVRKASGHSKRVKKDSDDKGQARCQKIASLLTKGFEGRDLEDAMAMEGNADEGKYEPKASEPTSSSFVSLHFPISTSRNARHCSLASRKVPTPEIKCEPMTPELIHSQAPCSPSISGFVRTEDIPPLDLSALRIDEEKPKVEHDSNVDLQAPAVSIDRIDSGFGFKPHVYGFSSNIMFTSCSDLGAHNQHHKLRHPGSQSPPPVLDASNSEAKLEYIDLVAMVSASGGDGEASSYMPTDDISPTASPERAMVAEEPDLLQLYTQSGDYDHGL